MPHLKPSLASSTTRYDDRDPHFPQSWNQYAYVGNQPLRHTDPTGLVDPAQLYGWLRNEIGGLLGSFGSGGGCSVNGANVGCNTAYGILASGSGLICPNNNCSLVGSRYRSPENGQWYTLAQLGSSFGWTAPNGADFGSWTGGVELGLPDLNTAINPLLLDELAQSSLTTPPLTFRNLTSGPSLAPTLHASPTYSRSYGAFLACEWGHTVADPDTLHTWAFATGGALGAILGGGPWAKFTALFGYAAYDIGGAEAIRAGCSAATYGPGH